MEWLTDCIKAFLVGGALCLIAQILIDRTKLTPARVLVIYVVLGVFLGAVGIYPAIAEFAGAGASVPLTGFGALIAKGTAESVGQYGLIGAFIGAFSSSAGGIAAALVFGFLACLSVKGKPLE